MPVLHPPVPPSLDAVLRAAVLVLRCAGDGRAPRAALHLGDPRRPEPGGQVAVTVDELEHPDEAGARPRARRSRPPALDDALRRDVVGALLGDLRAARVRSFPDLPGARAAVDAALRAQPPLAWLARPAGGDGGDAAWLRAVVQAGAEQGLDPVCVVVTPQGWWDPRGTAGRTWVRLRPRGRDDDELLRRWRAARTT